MVDRVIILDKKAILLSRHLSQDYQSLAAHFHNDMQYFTDVIVLGFQYS